ncbi:MAG: phosphatase PAP2 family protein [Gammaproteobacteria bacterium]|nr:phosphatase PAP2 family protein [Gammaproteobacteria bacterium]
MTEDHLRLLIAVCLPLAASLLVWLWAGRLRRRGRFSGAPGYGHAFSERLQSLRFDATAMDVSALGSSTLVWFFTPLFAVLFWLAGDIRAALCLLIGSVVGAGLGDRLKRLTNRTRPELSKYAYFGSSFPSSHTLMATGLYGTAALLFVRLQVWPSVEWFLVAAAALIIGAVGVSRVVLRVHYLSDVVAGLIVGLSIVVAVGLLYG